MLLLSAHQPSSTYIHKGCWTKTQLFSKCTKTAGSVHICIKALVCVYLSEAEL